MRILVYSWRDPKHPLSGGAEQVMHEHMKGWVEAGHKVTLFASRFEGAEKEENLDGVKILRKGYQMLGVHLAGFFYYLFGKQEKFDLVVDQFHGIPFFTPFYVRAPKLAVLQEVAREVWLINHLPKPLNWIVGIIGYLGEPLIFLFYKKVEFMVGSNSAKEDLKKMRIPGKMITVVPHGVILPKTKVKIPKFPKKTVVFLGALAKDKGIEEAIRAFSILDKKGKFQFWVIGRGGRKYLDELKGLVKQLGIKGKVKFWGFVSQKEKFELLARAHVMINPSIREGWGLVNIEANAMATPVVAYKSPGLIDSVKDGESGILCKENTPSEMAKEVLNILNNKNRYKTLKEGAVSWSKRFSWERSRRKSLDLIEKIKG